MVIFAERLKYLREKRGLLQKAVAADLSISNTTLSNYEQNISSPNPEILVAIADYFDTSADYLLGRTENSAPPRRNASVNESRLYAVCSELNGEEKEFLADLAAYLVSRRKKKTDLF